MGGDVEPEELDASTALVASLDKIAHRTEAGYLENFFALKSLLVATELELPLRVIKLGIVQSPRADRQQCQLTGFFTCIGAI